VSPWRASSLFEFHQFQFEAHFSQRSHFKLSDAFAGQSECIADLLQGQSSATTVPAVEARCSASELTGSIERRHSHDFFHHQYPFSPQNQVPGSDALPSSKPMRLAIAMISACHSGDNTRIDSSVISSGHWGSAIGFQELQLTR